MKEKSYMYWVFVGSTRIIKTEEIARRLSDVPGLIKTEETIYNKEHPRAFVRGCF